MPCALYGYLRGQAIHRIGELKRERLPWAPFEWLTNLRRRGIGWKAVRDQLTDYLRSKKATPERIKSQLKDVERHMRLWLLD